MINFKLLMQEAPNLKKRRMNNKSVGTTIVPFISRMKCNGITLVLGTRRAVRFWHLAPPVVVCSTLFESSGNSEDACWKQINVLTTRKDCWLLHLSSRDKKDRQACNGFLFLAFVSTYRNQTPAKKIKKLLTNVIKCDIIHNVS